MKPLHFFICVLVLIFAYSCSSDDDTGPRSEEEGVLIGTWVRTEAFAETKTESVGSTSISTSTGRDFEGSITFNSNPNTWIADWSAYFDIATQTTFGDITFPSDTIAFFDEQSNSGSWSINQNGQLVGLEVPVGEQYEGSLDQAYDIEIVNENRIILSLEYEIIIIDEDLDIEIINTGFGRSVLERK